jgi:hypothetical protein
MLFDSEDQVLKGISVQRTCKGKHSLIEGTATRLLAIPCGGTNGTSRGGRDADEVDDNFPVAQQPWVRPDVSFSFINSGTAPLDPFGTNGNPLGVCMDDDRQLSSVFVAIL